jgi:acyl-CoA reductase-like NAD-dependent aldehyde dehydrogenase
MSKTLDEKFAGTWSTMDMQDLAKFAEKFAELIVRECARLCDINDKEQGDILREHFGVKE